VLFGVIGFGVACLAAKPLSWFYGVPELSAVIVVQGLGFIIGAFRSVPGAILEKSLRFKTLALVEGGQSLVSAGATIALAFAGAGYWSLVLGNLIGNLAASVTVAILYPRPFLWPVLSDLREVLVFSGHLLTTRTAWYMASTSDVFLVGRLVGQAALGAYTFGATLANVPLEKVTGLVNRIAPAFYSAVQNDHAALRRYVTGLTEGLALITVPAAIGLALVAEDFVGLVLGDKWNAAIAPLQVLALYAALRSVSSVLSPLFFLTGGSRIAMFNGIFAVFLFPIGFSIGIRWGILGVAIAWFVVHPINLVPMYRHVFSTIQLSVSEYARSLWPAFSCALVMTVGVIAVRMGVLQDATATVRLGGQVLAGASWYLLALAVLHRQRLERFIRLIRESRNQS
jgi:PST family polysaccharide transporter